MKKMTLTLAGLSLVLATSLVGMAQERAKEKTKPRSSGQSSINNNSNNPLDDDLHGTHVRRGKTLGTSRKEFDKGYLPPNALKGYRGTTTVNQGNNFTVNWGDGKNTLRSAKAQRQNKSRAVDNTLGSFSPNSKSKNIWLPGTYNRGTFAKARGKQGH